MYPTGPGNAWDPQRTARVQVPPRRAPRSSTGRRAGFGVLLGVCVLLAAGIVVLSIRGIPSTPGRPVAAPPPSGQETLPIDLRTEPCSLLNTGMLGRYGRPTVYPDYGSFGTCEAEVADDADRTLTADVYLNGPGEALPPEQAGQMREGRWVYPQDSPSGICRRLIAGAGTGLRQGNTVLVETDLTEATGTSVAPCALADDVVTGVLDRLRGSTVAGPPRHTAGHSLISRDACSALRSAELSQVTTHGPIRGFAGWTCFWGSLTDSNPAVRLSFGRYDPPRPQDTTPLPGATRAARYQGDTHTTWTIYLGAFTGADGKPRAEAATLVVFAGNGLDSAAANQQATRLAGIVANRLR